MMTLVFDVGANIGAKTAELRTKGARIICFEPHPDCIEKLKERFAEDGFVRIVTKRLDARRVGASFSYARALTQFLRYPRIGRKDVLRTTSGRDP
jgi:FkbM family methyltransferase